MSSAVQFQPGKVRRVLRGVAAAIALGAISLHAGAGTVYKCTAADGKVTFRDTPCEGAGDQTEMGARMRAKPAPAATPEPAPESDNSDLPPPGAAEICGRWAPPKWKLAVTAPPKAAPAAPVDPEQAGKPDPLGVQTACSAMISDCVNKDGNPHNTLDACFQSAPRCATQKPWQEATTCCPTSCWKQYSDLRTQCVDGPSAFKRVLYDEHCVPGTSQMSGQPPH